MRLVSQANYNEIGQLWQKQLHSSDSVSFAQNIGYTYNERGWLLGSSAPLFAMQLQYNANPLALSISPRYNGDIASQSYGTPNSPNSPNINYFIYNYDKINRLLTGNSSAGNNENTITYDPEGNISTLYRYQGGTMIDQLAYLYTTSTNQLNTITDNSGNNNGLPAGTTTYNNYDPNGNMLSATNTTNTQGNKSFTYNLLNLPLTSTFATGSAAFTYDAAGTKLRKASTVGGVTTYTDYIGGIQYSGTSSESIAFIQTEEGKAVPNGATSYDYNYFLGDNLGNTRVSFGTASGTAVLYQQDDYYPFGMEISRTAYTPKNEYLYNKKELQEEFQEYDYGARFYDPVIARWTTIDPLAEVSRRWSTYNYVENNPIRLIDPDGMLSEDEFEQRQQQTEANEQEAIDGGKRPGHHELEPDEKAGNEQSGWAGEEFYSSGILTPTDGTAQVTKKQNETKVSDKVTKENEYSDATQAYTFASTSVDASYIGKVKEELRVSAIVFDKDSFTISTEQINITIDLYDANKITEDINVTEKYFEFNQNGYVYNFVGQEKENIKVSKQLSMTDIVHNTKLLKAYGDAIKHNRALDVKAVTRGSSPADVSREIYNQQLNAPVEDKHYDDQ